MKKQHGFTLIELLIVVAIIGILAAIAIPNFLNAQIRARIARVQGEMHAIATALEMYAIDAENAGGAWFTVGFSGPLMNRGSYPRHRTIPSEAPEAVYYLMNPLTTPIPYLTSDRLFDPFAPDIYGGVVHSTRYRYAQLVQWEAESGPDPEFAREMGEWTLQSRGPDMVFNEEEYAYVLGSDWCTLPYDPTNGIMSRGQLISSQRAKDHTYTGVNLDPSKL